MSADPLLTASELGELLGLSAGTILDRFECGDLPGFRLFGRKGGPVRFRLSEIEARLEEWRAPEEKRQATPSKRPPAPILAPRLLRPAVIDFVVPSNPIHGGEDDDQ
ncbi:MAG: helix-turn-helix domain-containing protein [Gaiellaceae bacterium]